VTAHIAQKTQTTFDLRTRWARLMNGTDFAKQATAS
jgi:hypothetical protein